ncbi:hypothetical protein CDAR_550091 [Caerostris darwini]|uniref:Uncharacterized protein n=1 Tax=Caerostris darwini TaxID=1538125 RepID=A0AAV4PGV7_9ARAC|nr:hypothetical protein CDAR_550091 [Caerostris darwini]
MTILLASAHKVSIAKETIQLMDVIVVTRSILPGTHNSKKLTLALTMLKLSLTTVGQWSRLETDRTLLMSVEINTVDVSELYNIVDISELYNTVDVSELYNIVDVT